MESLCAPPVPLCTFCALSMSTTFSYNHKLSQVLLWVLKTNWATPWSWQRNLEWFVFWNYHLAFHCPHVVIVSFHSRFSPVHERQPAAFRRGLFSSQAKVQGEAAGACNFSHFAFPPLLSILFSLLSGTWHSTCQGDHPPLEWWARSCIFFPTYKTGMQTTTIRTSHSAYCTLTCQIIWRQQCNFVF